MNSSYQKVFLSVKNIETALLFVNGLSVLERNVRILKKQNYSVIILTQPEQIERIEKAVLSWGVTLQDASSLSQNDSQALMIRGDCQYGLNTVEKGKNCFFDVDDMLKTMSREQVVQTLSKALFDEIYAQTEGWIARGINKKISFWLTRFLVRTNLTPNIISLFCFGLGLFGCACLLSKSWAARCFGVVLIQFNSILDGCDGEVARLKQLTSSLGAWLDTIFDDVLNNVMYVCLVVGYYLQTQSLGILHLGLATALASLGVSFFLYHFMITHNTSHAAHYRLSWENDQAPSAQKTASWFSFLKPVLKRDFFIFIVMILIILDLRLILILLSGIAIWMTFVLYLASFIHGLIKKRVTHGRNI